MSTEGPNSPATLTDLADGQPWTDPTNAASSDDSSASVNISLGSSSNLRASDFGFATPVGATITRIKVEVEASAPTFGSSGVFLSIALAMNSLGDASDQIATAFPPDELTASDVYIAVDQDQATWGTSLTRADINSAAFSVDVVAYQTGSTNGASVDHIRVTITYTAGGGTVSTVTAAAMNLAGQAITNSAARITPVTAATMNYSGQATVSAAATISAVIAATMNYAGQAVTTIKASTSIVTAGTMTYAGQTVPTIAAAISAVAAATMNYVGQAASSVAATVSTVIAATMSYVGQSAQSSIGEDASAGRFMDRLVALRLFLGL